VIVALLVLAAAGCSVVQSVNQIKDAHEEIAKAEEAVADGDYDAGLKSYLKAEYLLRAARDAGLQAFADDRKMKALDKTIQSLEETAVAEGFVRVDDRYCNEEEVGEATGYGKARDRQLRILDHGLNMGSRGHVSGTRDELHARR
jgi:hypothetical protein